MRNQTSAAVVSQAGHTHRMQTPCRMHAACMIGTTSGAARSATSVGREVGRHINTLPSNTQACEAGVPTNVRIAPRSTTRRSQRGGALAIETANGEGHGARCRAPQLHRAQVTALPLKTFLASQHFIMTM